MKAPCSHTRTWDTRLHYVLLTSYVIDISDLTAVQLHCPGIADFDPMPSILRRKTHAIVVNNELDDEIIDLRW